MTDTYMGFCSWCGGLNLPVQKITEIRIGRYYLKTMHSICCDEEYESYAPVREVLRSLHEASINALLEADLV